MSAVVAVVISEIGERNACSPCDYPMAYSNSAQLHSNLKEDLFEASLISEDDAVESIGSAVVDAAAVVAVAVAVAVEVMIVSLTVVALGASKPQIRALETSVRPV